METDLYWLIIRGSADPLSPYSGMSSYWESYEDHEVIRLDGIEEKKAYISEISREDLDNLAVLEGSLQKWHEKWDRRLTEEIVREKLELEIKAAIRMSESVEPDVPESTLELGVRMAGIFRHLLFIQLLRREDAMYVEEVLEAAASEQKRSPIGMLLTNKLYEETDPWTAFVDKGRRSWPYNKIKEVNTFVLAELGLDPGRTITIGTEESSNQRLMNV